jgi:uncharacterized protein (TIGR02453 family)
MQFNGWPASALAFYAGLEADNSKTYWTEHKATYDADVLAPMKALLDELEPEFGEARIFRPFRDVRFSADKSPYKTAIGATLRNGGYIQLSANGLAVGAGFYQMAPDQLERYRGAVDAPASGEDLRQAIAAVEAAGLEVRALDSLKNAPRGFAVDHPRVDLLRNKSLTAWRQFPIEPWLHTAAAEDEVVEALHGCGPLVAWLAEHVGSSQLSRR